MVVSLGALAQAPFFMYTTHSADVSAEWEYKMVKSNMNNSEHYMFQTFNLFSNVVWKTKISPALYNKKVILDTLQENYKRDPNRNVWDPEGSNWHHTYKNWDDPKFIPLDLSQLNVQYAKIVSEFLHKQFFNKEIKYSYEIINVTANKGGKNMGKHAHEDAFYAAVHYLNFKKSHSNTEFTNTNPIVDYSCFNTSKEFLNTNEIQNSQFFSTWQFDAQEDDIIFFPGFLKHEVKQENNTDDLRVTVAINIHIDMV